MYNEASTKALQAETIEWLSSLNAGNIDEIISANLEQLRNVLRFHEYRYYVQNDPLSRGFPKAFGITNHLRSDNLKCNL